MQIASLNQKYEEALELRNQIASIRLLTERQIVDNERRFDQDIMVFKRVGEKMLTVQMSVRKGVLLGKKEFSVDLQPQVEQEFLKAFYTTNRIPREILLNKPVWTEPAEKAALDRVLLGEAVGACFIDGTAASRQVGAGAIGGEKPRIQPRRRPRTHRFTKQPQPAPVAAPNRML